MDLSVNLVIDLVLAGILLIFVIIGIIRGLIKSVLNFIGTLAAVVGGAVLAEKFTKPVAEWLYPSVQEKILDRLRLEDLGLSAPGNHSSLSTLLPSLTGNVRAVVEEAAMNILSGVVRVVLFLIFFILLILAVKLLAFLLSKLFELPVLETFNRMGGAIFGLVEGMLILYLIVYLAPRFGLTWLQDNADGTYLLNFLLHVSPLEWWDFLKLQGMMLLPR